MNKRLKLKIGDNEIEIEGDEKFIDRHLKSFNERYSLLKIEGIAPHPVKPPLPHEKGKKLLSPAEFVRQNNPSSGTDKIIVLAKYLEDYRSLSEFSIMDINKVAREAKLGKIDNSYYGLGLQQGLLNKIKYGKYQLTLSGEDAVLAMSHPSS